MCKALMIILVTAAAGCSGTADPPAPAAPSSEAAAAATVTQLSGRAPAGALVTLEPAAALPMPEGNALMDQFSKAFVPETLFVRVGQPVIFKNSEDQLHNVTVVRTRTGTGVFNISQNQGDMYTHTFEQAGEYDVTCDVHPGMRATIVAANSPHAVYADARGAFSFQNVTPGAYRLEVSAGGRETERMVDVAGAQMDVGDLRTGGGV
ncbi:MAG TPA: carboxypeptidase regulatory-like domain-containing protein [Vicinamibacterales bacterium]|nr:carboxypeptidase regulatory-like domain-containing protein [Vicinamibacterales bacterium]